MALTDPSKKVAPPPVETDQQREYHRVMQEMVARRASHLRDLSIAGPNPFDSGTFTGRVKSDTRLAIGDQVLKEEDVAEMLDHMRFLRYLLETDPAMKERMIAFRTMQRLLR